MNEIFEIMVALIPAIVSPVAIWAIVEGAAYLREKRKSAAYVRMVDEVERASLSAIEGAKKAAADALYGRCEKDGPGCGKKD